ncbi:MAG: hypothetical protein L6R41_002528 [Letrouitia leprolyta]|nr:MAG: hypothetical protein L6R41_002528 [Letrouitia leprolyta]
MAKTESPTTPVKKDIIKTEKPPSILPFFLPKACPWRLNVCCTLTQDDSSLDHLGECQDFNLEALAWAIQNGLTYSCLERYLKIWPESRIKQELCQPIGGIFGSNKFPILFFAVERNSPEVIRVLCRAGADLSQPAEPSGLPVLVYCIISAEYELCDTSDSLFALLAMGADPYDSFCLLTGKTEDMWCDYIKNPQKSNTKTFVESYTYKDRWCLANVRAAMCRNFNLLQRYHFKMASLLPRQTPRQKQVAEAFNLTPLFEIPYHIVGQRLAAKTVSEYLLSHALHQIDSPIVLLCTGSSGMGKTELSKRMGSLPGISRCSPLNNFLTDTDGQKAVVFLDEFDKMNHSIYKSLLLIFDEGFYKDRRPKGKQLDCSKIIWILASNQGEAIIQRFWDEHLANKPEHHQLLIPLDSLRHSLERSFHTTLGAPLTGRLTAIIPFMPFSIEERAVTTYRFMRKVFNEARQDISVQNKHLARHLYLNFVDDGQLATHISEKYYFPELGARSLQKGVNTQILHRLTSAFLANGEGEIEDSMNGKPLECYDVRVEDLKGGFREVTVKANGSRSVLRREDDVGRNKFLAAPPDFIPTGPLAGKVRRRGRNDAASPRKRRKPGSVVDDLDFGNLRISTKEPRKDGGDGRKPKGKPK